MDKRIKKRQIWVSLEEDRILQTRADAVGMSVAEFLRQLFLGYEPKEKPPEEFYEAIKQLRGISNNLNQIARKANALNFIDELQYKKNADTLNELILDIKRKYLLPKKVEQNLSDS
jgi:uncharacterized protein YgfB (UPF0149 family)